MLNWLHKIPFVSTRAGALLLAGLLVVAQTALVQGPSRVEIRRGRAAGVADAPAPNEHAYLLTGASPERKLPCRISNSTAVQQYLAQDSRHFAAVAVSHTLRLPAAYLQAATRMALGGTPPRSICLKPARSPRGPPSSRLS